MGYRSDISYVIVFPSDAAYHTFLTTARTLSNQPIVNDVIENINGQNQWGDMVRALDETTHGVNIYKETYLTIDGKCYAFPAIAFKVENAKWYESYEHVHGHESLLALADIGAKQKMLSYPVGRDTTTMMTPCAYNFLRIGEDEDDVERRDVGRHVSMTTHPMYVAKSIVLCDVLKAILDEEDV